MTGCPTDFYSSESCGVAPAGARKAPGQPLPVSLPQDRRDVLSRFHCGNSQEDFESRRAGMHTLSRFETHFRYRRPAKRRRCKNCFFHAGALRCGIYSPNLHTRHSAETGRSGEDNGEFHGAGHVKDTKSKETTEDSSSVVSGCFLLFPIVGQPVGQTKKVWFSEKSKKERLSTRYPKCQGKIM